MSKTELRRYLKICVLAAIMGISVLIGALFAISRWNQNMMERLNEEKEAVAAQVLATVENSVISNHDLNLEASSEKIRYIRAHVEEYPQELLELLSRNVETVDFVYSYPTLIENGLDSVEQAEKITLQKTEIESEHPLFLQWDARWGAVPYGNSMMALSGCGPTCLSMAAVALTGDEKATPAAIGQYAMQQGYYVENVGTAWNLITEGCKNYGMEAEEVSLSEENMAECLQENSLLICSMSEGDFTTTGHFIVIYDYDDGYFQVNDPNSIINSKEKWDYERLEPQIRNVWALSAMA